MKKYLLLASLFVYLNSIYSQTSFNTGFKTGWKAGYCYNQTGCVAPVPPVPPVPTASENYESYQDGYNRGFQMGLDSKRSNSTNQNYGAAGAGVPTKAVTTNFGSIAQQSASNLGNARLNEWRNMRARRYMKYLNKPSKKTTIKLFRANKVLGLPYNAGISAHHFKLWIADRL